MKNERFNIDIEAIPNLFNKLHIDETTDERILKGELDVIDGTGKLWDTYQIEIKGSAGYPYSFPKLFEVGGAFPKTADWHVYENDQSCCVDIVANEIILCQNGLDVTDYLQRFVVSYFANQTYRKREGYYLYGEYAHGIFGILEFYQQKLRARTLEELIAMLDLVVKDYNPPRRTNCPFCLKTRFRHCHRDAFRELQSIKQFVHFELFTRLIPFFKANPKYRLPQLNSTSLRQTFAT